MVRKLSDKFGGRYWKAADVPKPLLLTADRITDELVGETRDERMVLWFADQEKGLILNKVNATALCGIAKTDDLDACKGTQLVLFATTCDFGGRTVPCLRLRAPRKLRPEPAVAEEEDDSEDIPF